MADIAALERALRKADAAGDVEAAKTIAAAIKSQRPAGPSQSGFAMGLADPIHGGAQLLTKMLPNNVVEAGNRLNNWIAERLPIVAKLPEGGVDQQVREREQAYQAQRGDTGIDWARLGGNIVNPVNLAIAGAAPAAAGLAGRMGIGAAAGGASASMAPVGDGDFATEKAKQIGMGAAGGAAVPAIASGLSRIISPKASTNPDLALLKAEGVRPTIGQTLGGAANATEEKLGSLPIVGDAIRSARRSAVEQVNSAAINRAVAPIGGKVKGVGTEAVKEAGDLIGSAYDAARAKMGHFQLDKTAAAELNNLYSMTRNLPAKERKAFDEVWSLLDGEVSPNGSIVAEGFKRFDSKAGLEAARFSGSSDAYQQKAGEAIKELKRVVTEAGKRANPDAAKLFKKADEAFANLVRVESASGRAVNSGGVFTPAQLGNAVKATDRSARDRATARGDALMQDLAVAGQNVVGNKIPNSGTFDRAALGIGTLGGGFMFDPLVPAGLLAGAGMYSSPAQSLLRGLVSSRPSVANPIAGLLNRSSPMLGPTGGLLALDAFQQ